MSDQTAATVREAEAAAVQARAQASQLKRQCLSAIADLLPAHADAVAKRLAQAQPVITKALGPSGVKALRDQIAARASDVAADLREAENRIEWPSSYAGAPRDVRSALFKYLYGGRLAALGGVLKAHGYDVHDDNAQGAQSAVLPQYLYDEELLEPLADALASLAAAEKALAQVQGAHDRETVDDLWTDD
jgi:hypothetical protein